LAGAIASRIVVRRTDGLHILFEIKLRRKLRPSAAPVELKLGRALSTTVTEPNRNRIWMITHASGHCDLHSVLPVANVLNRSVDSVAMVTSTSHQLGYETRLRVVASDRQAINVTRCEAKAGRETKRDSQGIGAIGAQIAICSDGRCGDKECHRHGHELHSRKLYANLDRRPVRLCPGLQAS
jgi:hypothetical protein